MSACHGHNGAPMAEGWIKRHRSVRDHWLVGHGIHVKPADPSRKRCHARGEAWEDLLMECRYEDGHISNGGVKMELRRGELLGAVSWLANRWNWTPKTVRGFLDALETDGMISLVRPQSEKGAQKGRQSNVITVCKYEKYQGTTVQRGQPEGQLKGDQRSTRGQPEGDKYKKERREEIETHREARECAPAPQVSELKPGEELVGHRVAVNCDTVRHLDGHFSISIPSLELLTVGLAMPRDEIKSKVVGHALQWGLEIESGKSPRAVVPDRVSNFLAASLSGDSTRQRVSAVRTKRAAQAPPERPASAPRSSGGHPMLQKIHATLRERESEDRSAEVDAGRDEQLIEGDWRRIG